jgi:hypothetical protein
MDGERDAAGANQRDAKLLFPHDQGRQPSVDANMIVDEAGPY